MRSGAGLVTIRGVTAVWYDEVSRLRARS
jgi:hypothetical protein